MPTTIYDKNGDPHEVDMFDIIPPDEGSMNQYYGRIGEGKTYAGTADAIDDLNRGQVVYTSWHIAWDGLDEREYLRYRFLYWLGIKKFFWKFPKDNWHFIDINRADIVEFIGSLTDCIIYLDEGHLVLDSYITTKMSREDRATVLHTRHYDRTINVLSQRPTAIHVVVRANVNRFFKLEKIFDVRLFWKKNWRIVRFRKTEFQDTGADDKPDEAREVDPETGKEKGYKFAVSEKHYLSRKRIRNAYDTKYLRGGKGHSQEQHGKRVDLEGEDYRPKAEDFKKPEDLTMSDGPATLEA